VLQEKGGLGIGHWPLPVAQIHVQGYETLQYLPLFESGKTDVIVTFTSSTISFFDYGQGFPIPAGFLPDKIPSNSPQSHEPPSPVVDTYNMT
jgi:hypothetical protein